MFLPFGEQYIKEDRKVKGIFNAEMSDEQIKMIEVTDRIFELEEKDIPSVVLSIKSKEEYIKYFYSTINYASIVRPKSRKTLVQLHKALLKDFKYNQDFSLPIDLKELYNDDNESYDIFPQGTIENAIEHDDKDSFIKLSLSPDFKPNNLIDITDKPSLTFINEVSYMSKSKITYMQLIAMLGAVNCFKVALITNNYTLINVNKYAIAGGNIEIIHLLEQNNVSFNDCWETSVKYHRLDICDWLLNNYKCKAFSISKAQEYYNERAFMFLMENIEPSNIRILEDIITSSSSTCNIEAVKYIMKQYSPKMDLFKAIQCAARNGCMEIIGMLTQDKRIPSQTSFFFKNHALVIAINNRQYETIKYIMEVLHADVEMDYDGHTKPIHDAAQKGDKQIFQYLVDKCNANFEARDAAGRTALYIASRFGHLEIVKYLIEEKKANKYAKSVNGWTSLHIAILYNNIDVVKYLLGECSMYVESATLKCFTPLHVAAYNDRVEIIDLLVNKYHANVNALDYRGRTPLYLSVSNSCTNAANYIVKHCNPITTRFIKTCLNEQNKRYMENSEDLL